eukprot:jgi/Chlat1/8524/Chrsp80S07816
MAAAAVVRVAVVKAAVQADGAGIRKSRVQQPAALRSSRKDRGVVRLRATGLAGLESSLSCSRLVVCASLDEPSAAEAAVKESVGVPEADRHYAVGSSHASASFSSKDENGTSAPLHASGGGDDGSSGFTGGGGGGDNGDSSGGEGGAKPTELSAALAKASRTLDSLPADLAAALSDGRVPVSVLHRYLSMETKWFKFLLNFGGFRERLLADNLFLVKVGIECGVGVFTKTAAELEKRRDKFSQELDFVFADVVMAIIADFMLAWLPAPTVGLGKAPARTAGKLATFLFNCPDNAFQVVVGARPYTLLQRSGAIVRNGAKLFAVGTGASFFGVALTNVLLALRRVMSKGGVVELNEEQDVLKMSVAYGAYMAVSSNLRYQVLAGVLEQRMLEPLLHKSELALSAACFLARTGNTFLGSLLWVDFVRILGLQKAKEA